MSLREIEQGSIRAFVERHSALYDGRSVLDYGCGDQRYRPIVEAAGGDYTGYDNPDHPGYVRSNGHDRAVDGTYEVVVCTQVLPFALYPLDMLLAIRDHLVPGGWLVITSETNWPAAEAGSVTKLTVEGARRLLEDAGYTSIVCEPRAYVEFEEEQWLLGWQAVARR